MRCSLKCIVVLNENLCGLKSWKMSVSFRRQSSSALWIFPVNLLTMLSRYDLINDIKVLRLCWTKCFIFGTYSVFLMWNYLCLMSWRGVVLASMTMLGWSRHTWEQRFRSSRVFVLVTQACVRYADRRQYIIYTRSIQLDGVGSQYMHRIDIY